MTKDMATSLIARHGAMRFLGEFEGELYFAGSVAEHQANTHEKLLSGWPPGNRCQAARKWLS